jgi:hypothetical protein
VASAHPVYDDHAAQFAAVSYTGLLEYGLCLWQALLAARQALRDIRCTGLPGFPGRHEKRNTKLYSDSKS